MPRVANRRCRQPCCKGLLSATPAIRIGLSATASKRTGRMSNAIEADSAYVWIG